MGGEDEGGEDVLFKRYGVMSQQLKLPALTSDCQ